jgi:hypothetical protein
MPLTPLKEVVREWRRLAARETIWAHQQHPVADEAHCSRGIAWALVYCAEEVDAFLNGQQPSPEKKS